MARVLLSISARQNRQSCHSTSFRTGLGQSVRDTVENVGVWMNRFRSFQATKYVPAALSRARALAFFILLGTCTAAVTAMAAEDPLPPRSAVPNSASINSAVRPMVVWSPGGTFTVQKEPANGNSKDVKSANGLTIPPQVVVPIARPIDKPCTH